MTGVTRELQAGTDYSVNLLPQDPNQTTLNIHPPRPLAPKTGYLVTLTTVFRTAAATTPALASLQPDR